jgi:ubiquinone/menaquinone biosynthesis C-methylase UbiE
MSDRSKREFFDREADQWHERCHRNDGHLIRQLVAGFGLKPGEWVLDLGTGSGILLPHLLNEVSPTGRVVGIDFSWGMIREAAKEGKGKNLWLVNASAEVLPLKGGIFNCLTCMDTFAHVDGQEEALSEMSRVLKRGGRLYIMHTLGRKELAERHREVGGVVQHDVLPPDSDMMAMMEKAGLKEVRIFDRPDHYLAFGEK